MNIQLKHDDIQVFPTPYYPIGAVYMSYEDVSPASMFGGTWERITDRFLYGAVSSDIVGGSATHTLTVNELPVHTHDVYGRQGSGTSTSSKLVIESYVVPNTNTFTFTGGGSGGAHDNMPPYEAVYMWRRIA